MTSMLNGTLPLILVCVSLNTLAQIMMKTGLNRLGTLQLAWPDLMATGLKIAMSPLIMGGLACFVLSLCLWLITLSRLDLSIAYPMMSLGYILAAILGYWFLGEDLTLTRVLGILVIMFGVYLVSRP